MRRSRHRSKWKARDRPDQQRAQTNEEISVGSKRLKGDGKRRKWNMANRRKANVHPPGNVLSTTSHMALTAVASLVTFLRSISRSFLIRLFSSFMAVNWTTISPGSSSRCLRLVKDGSGSIVFLLISSRRSGRPRRNLW